MDAAARPEPSRSNVAGSGVVTVKVRLVELLCKKPSPVKVTVNSGLLLKASCKVWKPVIWPVKSELLKLSDPVKNCTV